MTMPRIGRRLALTDDHLAAATLWVEGYDLPDDLVGAGRQLEEAGLARDGRVAPRLGELLDVLLRPSLRVHLEVLTPTGVEVDLMWARDHLVVAGDLRDGVLELEALDPLLLPTDLARRLGVRRASAPPVAAPLTVTTATLDALEAALRGGAGSAEAVLGRGGVDDPAWRTALTAVVRHRRSTWRLGSSWCPRPGGGPVHDEVGTVPEAASDGAVDGAAEGRSLTVIDGGPAGSFEVVPIVNASDRVTLHPRSASEIMTAIRATLPPATRSTPRPPETRRSP